MTTEVAIGDNPHNQRFSYTSLPRSLYYSSYKNVNDSEKPFYGNVMYDKRVVRGNTWALRRMAHEALVADEQEDRNRLKQKRNSIRQQIQAKLEAHKKLLPNVPKRQQPKGFSSKKGGRTKDDFKRTNIESRTESNAAKSLSESGSDNFEKYKIIEADMQISDKPNQDNEIDESMQNDDQKYAQVDNEMNPERVETDQMEMNKDPEMNETEEVNGTSEGLSEAGMLQMLDEKGLDAQINNEDSNEIGKRFAEETNKNALETVTEEVENELILVEDSFIKEPGENLSSEELLRLLLSKPNDTIDLYPLPEIESDLSSQVIDNETKLVQKLEHQIDEALKIVVDDALTGAEKEIQYEIEIEQLRYENEQLKEQHEQLKRDYETVKATVLDQKNIETEIIQTKLINELAQLENEKVKFASRQIAWDILNNELLPISLNKLIENGYIGYDDYNIEDEETIRINRVKFEDEEINAKIESSVKNDFLPWLCSEVWANVAHSTLSRLLDDAIDLQNSYCRRNAKNFIQAALDSNF